MVIVRYKCAPAAFMSSQFSSKLRGTTVMTDCAGDGSYRRVEIGLAPFKIYHSVSTEGKKTRFTFERSFEAQWSTRRIRSYIHMNESNPSQWTFLQLASFVTIPTVLWKRNARPASQWPPKLRKPVVKPRPFYYAPPSVFWDHGKLKMWNSNVMIWTAKTMHVDYLEQ